MPIHCPFAVLVPKGQARSIRAENRATVLRRSRLSPMRTSSRSISKNPKPVENSTKFNPENGAQLSEPKVFNLMFKTYVGAIEDESSVTYLRPETAQAMFVAVQERARGLAARNCRSASRKSARRFATRSIRATSPSARASSSRWNSSFSSSPAPAPSGSKSGRKSGSPGTRRSAFRARRSTCSPCRTKDRAFYSQGTYDLEYEFPFGMQELEGIAHRGNYDLKQHAKPAASRSNISTRKRSRSICPRSSSRARASTAPCWRCSARPSPRRR